MTKITTILFDFDGVISNTEPQYDIYIDDLGKRYNVGIDDFAKKVKGTTTSDIIKKYFRHLSEEQQIIIKEDIDVFEEKMDFPLVAGVEVFIDYLKKKGYKIGLVTSSPDVKMKRALSILKMTDIFDTIVTASRITIGKPNPMCYILAAKDLNVSPSECIVFEDSFHGIQAGKDAGMSVVGVSTTLSHDELKDKADSVIPNFLDPGTLFKYLG